MKPGILYLNKTYGRQNSSYLYKFKPFDNKLQIMYLPYEIPEVRFSKVFHNLYILVVDNKISKIFGATNNIEAYYSYQLHCAKLVLPSMCDIESDKIRYLQNLIINSTYEDRTSYDVFTIDNLTTTDYDDAFSINGNTLSVYIADVYHILEMSNLWNLLSEHVSNIYLGIRINMLCSSIIELCSLKANKISLALVMDYDIITCNTTFSVVKVRPYKNYTYGEPLLMADNNYIRISEVVYDLTKNIKAEEESRNVVEYLMRLMCFKVGAEIYKHGNGIFRTLNVPLEDFLPSNKYILAKEVTQEPYVHITSPMRRLVDILNMIAFFNLENSTGAAEFYKRWVNDIDKINITSKIIKRIQNEYSLLNTFDTIKDTIHKGLILSSETYKKDDIYYYSIFLEDIHLISNFQSTKIIYGHHMFRIFKFDKEANFRKKIKLSLIE